MPKIAEKKRKAAASGRGGRCRPLLQGKGKKDLKKKKKNKKKETCDKK